ncbi:MAG TPA: hypothetical protein VFQ36_09920 [Ktedonobacteraceae bacterium]|nr:hypothetical protein [Ktedonobacteraceae bacterium]
MCAQHRFEFSLAGEAEDEALRALLRRIAMPGNITLSFQREPSFLLAEQAGSVASQVMMCKDRTKDQIVGMGSRSIRNVYIDGKPAQVGYLSMLRGVPEARGNIALARGYRYLHTLHADGAVPYYFTTILDDNTDAKNLLTSARGGLPVYKPLGQLITYLIPLRRNRLRKSAGNEASRVDQQQLPQAIAFLQQWNSQYQFAPVYTLDDMLGQSKLLPAFCRKNFYIYKEQDEVRGTLGVWDQQSFKQTVVTAYSRKMQALRPFYNVYATITGNPGLPPTGSEIKLLYASFLSGSSGPFEALLYQVCKDWSGKEYDYLSVGICTDSPLSTIASRYATQQLSSTIYIVYWQDTQVALPTTDMPVHLEIATL